MGSHITIKTFFDGRSIERARQKVDFSTHEWQLGTRFSKVTLCLRRHERSGEISWSLIGHKKYNATKFLRNQKQEHKWALELVRSRYPPRGCSRRSSKLFARTRLLLAPIPPVLSASRPDYLPLGLRGCTQSHSSGNKGAKTDTQIFS